jgi:hypothetical protein
MHHNRASTVRTSPARRTLDEWAAASEAQSAVWARTPGEMDGGRNRIVRRSERGGLIGCSKGRRARDGNPFQTALSRRATAQVGQVVHAELCGGLSEPHSAGGEESAEEAT